MWRTIFSIFSYPCKVTDVLADVMLDVEADMLPDIGMIAMDTPAIALEFMVPVPGDVGVLADELAVLISGLMSVIDVGMLADEDMNSLAAVMTPLRSALPAP